MCVAESCFRPAAVPGPRDKPPARVDEKTPGEESQTQENNSLSRRQAISHHWLPCHCTAAQ